MDEKQIIQTFDFHQRSKRKKKKNLLSDSAATTQMPYRSRSIDIIKAYNPIFIGVYISRSWRRKL
jgi:hypothetical protein